jgi:hypothetical protein
MASNTNGGSSQPLQASSNPYSHILEPSFLNHEPQDEFVKEITDQIGLTVGDTSIADGCLHHQAVTYIHDGFFDCRKINYKDNIIWTQLLNLAAISCLSSWPGQVGPTPIWFLEL